MTPRNERTLDEVKRRRDAKDAPLTTEADTVARGRELFERRHPAPQHDDGPEAA